MNKEDSKHDAWTSPDIQVTVNTFFGGRSWKRIDGFSDWLFFWEEKTHCVEQALGLLHAIPLYEARTVRFLIAASRAHDQLIRVHNPRHECRGAFECDLRAVGEAAERILIFRILKTEGDMSVPNAPWWSPLSQNVETVLILFRWLADSRIRLGGGDDAHRAVKSFLRSFQQGAHEYRDSQTQKTMLSRLDDDTYYRALLEYDCEIDTRFNSRVVEVLEAIALGADHFGQTCPSLEEALGKNGIYHHAAELVLLARAYHKGERAKSKREQRSA